MSSLAYKLMSVYILLVVALSVLGVQNRLLLKTQLALFREQEKILNEITIARQAADSVEGPEAVRAWALAHKMEPLTPDETALSAPFLEAPETKLNPNKIQLEIWTKWY